MTDRRPARGSDGSAGAAGAGVAVARRKGPRGCSSASAAQARLPAACRPGARRRGSGREAWDRFMGSWLLLVRCDASQDGVYRALLRHGPGLETGGRSGGTRIPSPQRAPARAPRGAAMQVLNIAPWLRRRRDEAEAAAPARRPIRSGTFEIDIDSGELRKSGGLVRLRQQIVPRPFAAGGRAGLGCSRATTCASAVDGRHVRRLRPGPLTPASRDPPPWATTRESPVFVETLPRRATAGSGSATAIGPAVVTALPKEQAPISHLERRGLARLHACDDRRPGDARRLAGLGAALLPPPPRAEGSVTFQRGWVDTARFVPGGGIAYGATWERARPRCTRIDRSADARRLDVRDARGCKRCRPRGELAVLKGTGCWRGRLSLEAPPRDLLDRVVSADFGPDGPSWP